MATAEKIRVAHQAEESYNHFRCRAGRLHPNEKARGGEKPMNPVQAKAPAIAPETRPTTALQLYLETIIYKTRER
ncbi:MAG: hypothetical protein ACRD5W_13815, partial [Candidatus Acidiferrales bacterium]